MQSPSTEPPLRVAVIGGGIAGLAAAHALCNAAPQASVAVYEAASRVGGIIESVQLSGYLIERSADSFITHPPHALELCRQIGIADELLGTAEVNRRALVVCRGRPVRVPDDFVVMSPRRLAPLLRSPVLSLRGKLRLLEEPSIPPRSPELEDESVAAFARRRFGEEAYERLIQPLVGGIYTGDPERLSMAATLPRFWQAEREYGSILLAERVAQREGGSPQEDQASGARYGLFQTLRGGMSTLAEAIAGALPAGAIRLEHRVSAVEQMGTAWRLSIQSAGGLQQQMYDAVVVAVPAAVAAGLLSNVSPLGQRLSGIESAGATVVSLGYRREQISHPLDAFGLVVPAVERRQILAASFLSNKFAYRAPPDCVLIRAFVGGALQPELVDAADDEILRIVGRELGELLGLTGEPQLIDIARWHGAMPQYHVGHLQRIEQIKRLLETLPGLALAGNAYRGVGIAHCVHSGQQAAGSVLHDVRDRSVQ